MMEKIEEDNLTQKFAQTSISLDSSRNLTRSMHLRTSSICRFTEETNATTAQLMKIQLKNMLLQAREEDKQVIRE